MNRAIRAGQTITLRARFKDDLGDDAQAASVTVHIFEPGEDTSNNANAIANGSAVYFGEGIFEFQYTVPANGPDGMWSDKWSGTLTGQTLEALFVFEVSANGTVEIFSNQLNNNNIVQVTLSGLKATDGSLIEDSVFSFLTVASPVYSDLVKVKLEIGAFVRDIPDMTIQMGILEASLEADQMTFVKTSENPTFFAHARREWTTCKTALMLLTNLGNAMLSAKTLGDLHVEYDSKGLQVATEKAFACMQKWEPQLLSGGTSRASQQPRAVVKGELDPDRPSVGRTWDNTPGNVPAANDRYIPAGNRRKYSIFNPNKKWW